MHLSSGALPRGAAHESIGGHVTTKGSVAGVASAVRAAAGGGRTGKTKTSGLKRVGAGLIDLVTIR